MNNKLGLVFLILGFVFLKIDFIVDKLANKSISPKTKSIFQIIATISFLFAIIISFKYA